MEKVWVVTKGEYSNYSLMRIFSLQEPAAAYAKHVGGDVEEWGVDHDYDLTRIWWLVSWYSTSGIRTNYQDWMIEDRKTERVDAGQMSRWGGQEPVYWLKTYVCAPSDQAAIKIGAERFAEYEARLEGYGT